MERQRAFIILIIILVITAVVTLVKLPLQLGLDLTGGSQLTLQLQTTPEVPEITADKLEGVRTVVDNRVNGLGVSEAVVQSVGNDRILVQLPGVSDPKEAERVLGGTAQLDFRTQTDNPEIQAQSQIKQQELQELIFQEQLLQGEEKEAQQAKIEAKTAELSELTEKLFEKTELNGEKLKNANYQPAQQGTDWEVVLEFNDEGGRLFAELTKKIAGTGRPLGIFLDNELISAPSVSAEYAQTGIMGGRATISGGGGYTLEQARELALQLEGGALPVPVKIVENRTVGATLGQDSIRRSIYAGLAGLGLVLAFMIWYYRLPGLIADIALIIYTLLNLACFSLAGVTLTLPGIAGFILSIGMAVDANVLIFERTREELRAGKTLYRGVESGFYRAFSSILDGNVTTLIACAALFWLGSGLVKGFALTLAIGVLISMFTALTCSRTFLLISVLGFPAVRQRPELFCPNLKLPQNQGYVLDEK